MPPPATPMGPGDDEHRGADRLIERLSALAEHEEARRDDVLLVEDGLVVDEERDATVEDLDGAPSARRASSTSDRSRERARSAWTNVVDLPRAPAFAQRTAARVEERVLAGIAADELARPAHATRSSASSSPR